MTIIPSTTLRWFIRILVILGLIIVVSLALAVILVAIPLTRRLFIVAFAHWILGGRLESIAVDLDIQPNLRWIFTLLITLPLGFGLARMTTARQLSKGLRGLGLTLATLVALLLASWWQTRHFNFDSRGNSVVYLSFRRDGVRKSYSPGIDRETGRKKYEATVDRVLWLSQLAREPVRQVDPARDTLWFDPNSGEPNMWYVRTGTNQWQFFNRPHFHQQLRVEVSPITPEVMAQWRVEQDRQAAAAEACRRQREEEAKAIAASERIRLEAERYEKEATAARLKEQEARRIEQERARALEQEAERRRRLHQATAEIKRREILDRRAREATAPVDELVWLIPGLFVPKVCPDLNGESFQKDVFSQDFAERRFRVKGKVSAFEKDARVILFEPVTIGGIHLMVEATLQRGSAERVRAHREVTLAGTVAALHISTAGTNINGLPGEVCVLDLGNSLVVRDEPRVVRTAEQSLNKFSNSKSASRPVLHEAPLVPPSDFAPVPSPVGASTSYTPALSSPYNISSIIYSPAPWNQPAQPRIYYRSTLPPVMSPQFYQKNSQGVQPSYQSSSRYLNRWWPTAGQHRIPVAHVGQPNHSRGR